MKGLDYSSFNHHRGNHGRDDMLVHVWGAEELAIGSLDGLSQHVCIRMKTMCGARALPS